MAVQIRLVGPEDEVRAAHMQLRGILAAGSQHITGVQTHRKGACWYGDVDMDDVAQMAKGWAQ